MVIYRYIYGYIYGNICLVSVTRCRRELIEWFKVLLKSYKCVKYERLMSEYIECMIVLRALQLLTSFRNSTPYNIRDAKIIWRMDWRMDWRMGSE